MVRFSGLLFAIASLVGPLIRLATWPPGARGAAVDQYVYNLVLYLWLAQPLAVYESSIGHVTAGLLAVGANVLVFVVIGLIVGALAGHRHVVSTLYAAICGLLLWYGLWIGDFNQDYIRWAPLISAMGFYACPFFLVAKIAGGRAHEPKRFAPPGSFPLVCLAVTVTAILISFTPIDTGLQWTTTGVSVGAGLLLVGIALLLARTATRLGR